MSNLKCKVKVAGVSFKAVTRNNIIAVLLGTITEA